MAVQLVAKAWSALTKWVCLEHFGTVYSFYFMYDGKTALLRVKMSRSSGF